MAKEFKVPSKKQPIFKFVRKIIKFIKCRKIKVVAQPDKLVNKCIFVVKNKILIDDIIDIKIISDSLDF